jgi:hypothetical protein
MDGQIIILLVVSIIWYFAGVVILSSVDINFGSWYDDGPSEIHTLRVWKIIIIGGPIMLLHWTIAKLSAIFGSAKFNYSLSEWLRR